jgi:hypothetical protein
MYANGEGVPQDDAFRASSGSRRPRKAHNMISVIDTRPSGGNPC